MTCPSSMKTWSVHAANMNCSVAGGSMRLPVAATRSADWLRRFSMKRRYHRASCADSASPSSGATGKRGRCPCVSRPRNARPWVRARPCSLDGRCGSRLSTICATVIPGPHPSTRFAAEKRSPISTTRAGGTPPASNACTALATTSVSPSSRPSTSRRSSLASSPPVGRCKTCTSSPSIATSKATASSAHRSSVDPDDRSNRAWCQWQVSRPSCTVPRCSGNPMCGQRSSIAQARPPSQKTTTGNSPAFPTRKPALRSSAADPTDTPVTTPTAEPYDLKVHLRSRALTSSHCDEPHLPRLLHPQ